MGKIQPFKAIGSALQTVSPLASMIPGVSPLYAAGAGYLGNFLNPQGGSRPQRLPGGAGGGLSIDPMLRAILEKQYGLANQGANQLLDFDGRSDEYRRNALQEGARSAESLGGQVAQQTGNDFMRSAVALGNQNAANQAGNQFQSYLFGPEGRAQAYAGAQGLFNAPFNAGTDIARLAQGNEALHLQKYGINKQYQKPTVFESLFGSALGSLPQILQNSSIFKKPTPKPVQGSGPWGNIFKIPTNSTMPRNLTTPYTGYSG